MIIDPIRIGEEIRFAGRGNRHRVVGQCGPGGAMQLLQSIAAGTSPADACRAGLREGDPASSTARGPSARKTPNRAVHARSGAARLPTFAKGCAARSAGAIGVGRSRAHSQLATEPPVA